MKILETTSSALLLVGGLNWGLVGLMNFNLVTWLLGEASMASTIAYGLVGLSAVYQFVTQFMMRENEEAAECATS